MGGDGEEGSLSDGREGRTLGEGGTPGEGGSGEGWDTWGGREWGRKGRKVQRRES